MDTTTTIDHLKLDTENPRRRTERGRAVIAHSLRSLGAARSIVIDESDTVLAGNGVVEGATEIGLTRVRIIDADGDELIAVRRRGLTDAQKRELAIADNRAGELAEWNPEAVIAARDLGLDLEPFFTGTEQDALASAAGVDAVLRMAGAEDEAGTAAPEQADPDAQTFSCTLTVEQERTVRAALRTARAVYQVEQTGEALAAALAEWTERHTTEARPRRRRRAEPVQPELPAEPEAQS